MKVEIMETGFSSDTQVLMEGGKTKQIEYVAVGDKVLSRCEFTGEMAYKKVIKTFHQECVYQPDDSYGYEVPAYYVYYSTTHPEWSKGKGGLHVTPGHPIWVREKGWVAVRDLQPGDQFLTANGAQAIAQQVEPGHETYNVHNLHVENFHTYFVDSGIWVRGPEVIGSVCVES